MLLYLSSRVFQKIELWPFENSRKPQLYMGMRSHVGGFRAPFRVLGLHSTDGPNDHSPQNLGCPLTDD